MLNNTVICQLSPILALALRSLLVNKIQKATQFQENQQTCAQEITGIAAAGGRFPYPTPPIPPRFEIPLSRVKGELCIRYVSAVAFKRAGAFQQSAISIARSLVQQLTQTFEEPESFHAEALDTVWQHFKIAVIEPGWIEFSLNDSGTAAWLQALASSIDQPLQILKPGMRASDSPSSPNAFCILYNHARCCSLLRAAAQEDLIALSADFATELSVGPSAKPSAEPSIVHPHPLPWLAGSSADRLLITQHPAEQQLIVQIAVLLDRWVELSDRTQPDPAQLWQLAARLSQSFSKFDAACRIWGEVKQTDLALARLGLVGVTQKILRSLLAELGVEAPAEL